MMLRSHRKKHWKLILVLFFGACTKDAAGPPPPPPVASVQVQPDSVLITVGATTQFSASLRDAAGNVLAGRSVAWTSSDPTGAGVSAAGAVNAVAAGKYIITATSEGKSDTGILIIAAPQPNDYSIVGAQFTQGVQAADGSIPVVLGGNAAAINVLVRAATNTSANVQVVLRLLDASGTIVRTDTALTSGPLGAAPGYDRPNAQILVPATALRAGLRWQVEVDPRHIASDDTLSNNLFPRTGTNALSTVTVPALKVRIIPIVLAAHNNRTATVSTAQFPEYLRTLQSVHPLGAVTASIGGAITTSASFGIAPRGGESPFWTQVLSELDLARVADPSDPDTHWFGLVFPPVGFNFTVFGGFAYIPGSGQNTGSGTRTALAVQVGWFGDQAHSRELFAHELGHNFGRRHAPCGGAAGPDPAFPSADGTIGMYAHDVNGWANGRASSAVTLGPQTGDVMGYCTPVWSSEYTYRGVLAFRGSNVVVAKPMPAARTRVLIVRGSVGERGVAIEPVFALDGRPTRPESPESSVRRAGAHVLTGRDASGRVLFSYDFEPAELDHTSSVRLFTFAIPLDEELERSLHSIDVRGPAGGARMQRPPDVRAPQLATTARIERLGGTVNLACLDPNARGIVALDAASGSVLGTAAAPSLRIAVVAGTRVTIACSDGIRTTRDELTVR